MTARAKSATFNLLGAIVLAGSVILRHTTTNVSAAKSADTILPIIGFVLITAGLYYMIKAKREAQP